MYILFDYIEYVQSVCTNTQTVDNGTIATYLFHFNMLLQAYSMHNQVIMYLEKNN